MPLTVTIQPWSLNTDNDGIKAWNLAPAKIKDCLTFASAKNEIKKFAKTIPI